MKGGDACMLTRERALALGMDYVAGELRLIDPQDFVAFIRLELFGNVANLVNSSTEMYYKPGALKFGMSGEVELQWGEAPRVILDMEFDYQQVNAYFRLILDTAGAAVELTYLSFADASDDAEANTRQLIDALAAARQSDGRRISRLAELASVQLEAAS